MFCSHDRLNGGAEVEFIRVSKGDRSPNAGAWPIASWCPRLIGFESRPAAKMSPSAVFIEDVLDEDEKV